MQENLIIEVLYLLNPAVDIGFNISEIADELNVKNADVKAACLALVQDKKIRTSVSCGRNIYYGKGMVLEERPKAQPAPAVEPAAVAPVVAIEQPKKRGRPRKVKQISVDKADIELVLTDIQLVLAFANRMHSIVIGGIADLNDPEVAALVRLNDKMRSLEVVA